MSDFNSSLPVRTENNGDVAAKIVDGTIPSRALTVNADGSVNVTDNGGSLTVDGVDFDIRDIDAAQDNIAISDGTDTLAINADGSINVNFSVDKNYGTVGANTLRTAAQIGNATGAADFNAGATGAQTLRVEANQGAPNTAANKWPVSITDGTDTVNVTAAGELNVISTAQPGVDIGDVTVNNGAGAAAVNIQDGGNSITVDGTVSASNFPATVDTNYGTVGANTIRTASQIGNATGGANFNAGATGAQTLRVEANQGEANAVADAWPVKLTDGVDTVAVNTDGSINVVVSDTAPGTPINNYNTVASVAGGATSNHDYTVTAAKTLSLNQIEAAGSGKMKIEVQVETGVASGVFNTRWVQFNSTANTNMSIHIENPISVAAGVRVRVIRTNKEGSTQDVYSTISGYELP